MTYTRLGAGLQVAPRLSLDNRDLVWVEVNGIAVLNVYRQPYDPQVLDYVTHLTPPPPASLCGRGGFQRKTRHIRARDLDGSRRRQPSTVVHRKRYGLHW